jgi:hypothetical protein
MPPVICRCSRIAIVGAVVSAALLQHPAPSRAQLNNPIPQPITKQGLRVEIHDLVQMPSTQGTLGGKGDHSPGARARINFLEQSPDGRRFTNDLRGQLYTLDANHQPQLYVDLDAANGGGGSIFPAMQFNNGLAAGFISFEFHPGFSTIGDEGFGKFYTIHFEDAQATTALANFATVDERAGNHPVDHHTVISEWTTPTPLEDTWNPAGTRRELLRVGTTADSYFHPYGDLEFNPLASPGDADYGKLYISGGDWGYINGAGAPQGSGNEGQPGQLQRLDTLAGTLIRIDPRSPAVSGGPAGFGDYTIPADNPFVDGDPNTFDEIYAFGFRNGHRMAWDQSDGQLYAMSVGHANIEEIERILPGGNYGWTNREGTFVNGNDLANGGNGDADRVFANNVPDALDVDFRGEEYLYPVVQYDHGEGNAIAGGFVYEGTQIPQLQGKFVFGDIVNGRIFAADMTAIRNVDVTDPAQSVTAIEEIQLYTVSPGGVETNVDLRDLVGSGRADLRFGSDSTGEIYILTKTDGYIRRLGADFEQPADRLAIIVNRTTGEVTLKNPTQANVDLDSYSILSATGSLNPANGGWSSLADQGVSGWQEAGPLATAISELSPLGSLDLSVDESRSLGQAFSPNPPAFGVNVSDLAFRYSTLGGDTFTGVVQYIGDDTNNLVLTVNLATGQAILKNSSPYDVSIDGYSIESESQSLVPANGGWNSLADQGVVGWQESGPDAGVVSELHPTGSTLVASGAEFDLGALFALDGSLDLALTFLLDGAAVPMTGAVVYQTGLSGDYNLDGHVDAADYTTWRDSFGAEVVFGTGADGNRNGVVDQGDYVVWKQHFGESLPPGAGQLQSVPEPAITVILGCAILMFMAIRPAKRSGKILRFA